MSIAQTVAYMFPDALPTVDYQIGDDGTGQRIVQWRYSSPQPSDADIAANEGAAALSDGMTKKLAELSKACDDTIFSGFQSSALGVVYSYPAKSTDQQNLASSVLASVMPNNATGWTTPFWCADATGKWAFVMHTAAQIQKVGEDAKMTILAAMSKNAQLAAEVMAATTVDAVSAVNWS